MANLEVPSVAVTRSKQVDDAKTMEKVVMEKVSRIGGAVPPYEFVELIGKGAFGRVYKCRNKNTREIVAVKILDVDDDDFKVDNKLKDENIADFIKEVNTLKHLKDSGAENINRIHEAFDLHSQLWIVSEYCPGGSVFTLMKARNGGGLDERFVIPIARELAVALRGVHRAGVIHRDVKCGNVLVSEEGQIQLCDFGVSAIMESDISKRSTIIGTPYWMPPEMHADIGNVVEQGYGTEVDCWAYGCTVYEMATGMPPYHKFNPSYLRQVLKSAPRLEPDKHTKGLCDFVAYCLQEKPEDRPNAQQILQHPFISNTSRTHPTSMVRQLIDHYMGWERKGGQRMSLFNPMGAAAPQLAEQKPEQDDWIFSTTDSFEQGFERRYSQLGISAVDFAGTDPGALPAVIDLPAGPVKTLTPFEAAQEEAKAKRGEKSMERLFDTAAEPYDYEATSLDDEPPLSDLPLRNISNGERAANRETLIDLDTSGLDITPTFNFDFSDVPTVKGRPKSNVAQHEEDDGYYGSQEQDSKRATVDWKFPSLTVPADTTHDNPNRRTLDWTFPSIPLPDASIEPEPEMHYPSLQLEADQVTSPAAFRPNLARIATEPVGQFNDFLHPPAGSIDSLSPSVRDSNTPVIDLDFGGDYQPSFDLDSPADIMRSSSPAASLANSMASMVSMPFELEQDPVRREEDLKRYSQRHRQHRSETRSARQLHARDQSYPTLGHQGRERTSSIDSSASSNMDLQMSGPNMTYNRSMGAQMQAQLQRNLQASMSSVHSRPGSRARNLGADSFDDAESDAPLSGPEALGPPFHDGSIQRESHHRLRAVSNTDYDTDSSAYNEPFLMPRSQFRDELYSPINGYDSEDSKFGSSTALPVPDAGFPAYTQPNLAVMVEGADPVIVAQELFDQLGDMAQALFYTADVLQQHEDELAVDQSESESEATQTETETEEEGTSELFA